MQGEYHIIHTPTRLPHDLTALLELVSEDLAVGKEKKSALIPADLVLNQPTEADREYIDLSNDVVMFLMLLP